MANLKTFIQYIPEIIKVFCGTSRVDKVERDHALIEAAIVFWLTIIIFRPSNIIETITSLVGRQETSTRIILYFYKD